MDDAGVPITPGYHGKDQSPKFLKMKAGEIGYPVLIKAVAGGGGKGMRKVEADADFDAALASCKREASSSFGNDDVLIEKYIQSPRHIEVQVFGDTHGNIVHMFERDCSLQRRHQKVIEEAPAPGMTDAVRKAMTDAAIKAAKAVNYVGAGTVEFIVDGSGELRTDGFWFMEMNTRLQVEHPVTEEITGLDLVEWQIRVARGEALPKQDTITISGHAVEARIYAEDPANDFLPSVGNIEIFSDPISDDRFDSAFDFTNRAGHFKYQRVSPFYDPMIAKVISHDKTRSKCITKLQDSLASLAVAPIKTNVAYLYQLIILEEFRKTKFSTHFISEKHDDILVTLQASSKDHGDSLALGTALQDVDKFWSMHTPSSYYSDDEKYHIAWRLNRPNKYSRTYYLDGVKYDVEVDQSQFGNWVFQINGEPYENNYPKKPDILLVASETRYSVFEGHIIRVSCYPPNEVTVSNMDTLIASMPGKIIALNYAPGDTVKSGDPLVIMEAMKMEQTLSAPRDGVVAEVSAAVGDLVTDGALLVRLVEEET
jgi:3-methylcrotonyl-CoA carboxylase alpha subunit